MNFEDIKPGEIYYMPIETSDVEVLYKGRNLLGEPAVKVRVCHSQLEFAAYPDELEEK